jgi:putative tryptophan/tyrosine transport system substrate-binding protein
MRRREFITLLGSAAAAWPLAARAQQTERVRRIGLLMGWAESDPEVQPRMAAFMTRLRELGWIDGRNCRIELHWSAGDVERMHRQSKELVASAPDVIVAMTNPMVEAVHNLTRTIPIVFVQVSAPVESGLVASMARPGRNMTGFANFEGSMGGKWVELLKEVAPGVVRIVVLMHPEIPPHVAFWRAVQSAAPSFGVELTAAHVHGRDDVEHAITTFAPHANGGLIVFPHPITATNRNLIVQLAARHRLPAIYPLRFFSAAGGLLSYGIDQVMAPGGKLRRPYSSGREAGRSSGAGADQVRAGHQPQDCQSARRRRAADAARPRRRGDRMSDRAGICKVCGRFCAFAAAILRAIIDKAAIERDVPKSPFGQRTAPMPTAGITLSPDHHLRGLSACLAGTLAR